MRMSDLMDVVVWEMYCDWGIFKENVLSYPVSWKSLTEEVSACSCHNDLVRLANRFI